jgi:hypothetical protein
VADGHFISPGIVACHVPPRFVDPGAIQYPRKP